MVIVMKALGRMEKNMVKESFYIWTKVKYIVDCGMKI